MKPLAAALLACVALALPAGGVSVGPPGVTSTEILLGGTVPLSGPASPFGVVGPGANAYFKYVNAHGGVNGRKIKYLYRDDGYDPSKTIDRTRELVQQDKVFAIFNSVGTEHNLAIRGYLNAVKVPQLFVGTGASAIGRGHKAFPGRSATCRASRARARSTGATSRPTSHGRGSPCSTRTATTARTC
jgi:branched-chain amino acid transport system substrate-binding protein